MRRFHVAQPRVEMARFAQIKSCGIIVNKPTKLKGGTVRPYVKSVSKWKMSPFCDQFVDIVHNPTLSLPTGTPLCPSAEVFAELDIKDKILRHPPKRKQVFEHCNIEAVMKSLKLPTMADGSPNLNVLLDNQRMVSQLADARLEELARALREELSPTRYRKKIDQCAEHFLILCGFDTSPFEITAEGCDFKIFGKWCYSDCDHFVVVTPNNDLVLIFEDKSLQTGQVLARQGHLGQIVGELLQILSVNRDKKTFRSVFAVRFINYRITAFRVDPLKATLRTLCDTDKIPTPKMKILCTEKMPKESPGLSLIDATERRQVLQLMADIRSFIVNEK